MCETLPPTIAKHFAGLDDPGRYNRWHLLLDIITIAICAVICGADDWIAVEEFGKAKANWFVKFLKLPHGIPSHDTFRRVFACLDAGQFQDCFIAWVRAVHQITQGQVVAIDGKSLRLSWPKSPSIRPGGWFVQLIDCSNRKIKSHRSFWVGESATGFARASLS